MNPRIAPPCSAESFLSLMLTRAEASRKGMSVEPEVQKVALKFEAWLEETTRKVGEVLDKAEMPKKQKRHFWRGVR